MARLFEITTAADVVAARGGAIASLTYTVTNLAPKAQRCTLSTRVLDAGQASAKLAGPTEIDFGPGATQQVQVDVTVQGTGRARVRLDAMSTANPEEDYTEGPVVAVTPEAAPPVAPPRKTPSWLWLVVALVVLLVGGVVTWMATRPEPVRMVDVPDLVKQPADQAKLRLEQMKLAASIGEQASTEMCAGIVMATAPPAGQKVAEGTTVALTVSKLPFGPATCRSGFVWRELYDGDTVCVTPPERDQARAERSTPNRFGFGGLPGACLPGFVQRVARPGDITCVPLGRQVQIQQQNALAAQRRACNG